MTNTNEPRFRGMHRDGEDVINEYSDGTVIRHREEWGLEDAQAGLIQDWLNPRSSNADGSESEMSAELLTQQWRSERFIKDADGATVGVLIAPEKYEKFLDAQHTLTSDAYADRGKADVYIPRFHSDLDEEWRRPLNVDDIERFILKEVHGDEEVTAKRAQLLHDVAFMFALTLGFDADDTGVVPLLVPLYEQGKRTTRYQWALRYKTDVRGIYLDPRPGFLGETWTLISASGWAITSCSDRESADALAVKLHEATPGLDWFTLTGPELTEDVKGTLLDVIRAHRESRRSA